MARLSSNHLRHFSRLPVWSGFDALVLPGQSNMRGAAYDFDAELDATHPLVYQFKADNSIVLAQDPLDHPDEPPAGTTSLGFHIGRAYAERTGRRVLLIPVAYGSTGLVNQWNPGGPQYDYAVELVLEARRLVKGFRLVAMHWHQGEHSDVSGLTGAEHTALLTDTFNGFRTDLSAPRLPIIIGGMCPDWYTGNAAREEIQAALEAFPSVYTNCAYASSDGFVGSVAGGNAHFDAASVRSFGPLYDAALVSLIGP